MFCQVHPNPFSRAEPVGEAPANPPGNNPFLPTAVADSNPFKMPCRKPEEQAEWFPFGGSGKKEGT